jgi:hypothetical protein
MQKTITINLTPEGNLQLPLEIREQFSNSEQYLVITSENTITFRKATKFSWGEWKRSLDRSASDPNEMTTEEICELVREVRRESKR